MLSGKPSKRPRTTVVVVRDSARGAINHPPSKEFARALSVAYHHADDGHPVPSAAHTFFNCRRVDDRLLAMADEAQRAGSRLTFLVRHVDARLARYVEETGASLLPAAGFDSQIAEDTLFAAIRHIIAGHRVVAGGFIANSTGTPRQKGGSSTFINVLAEASHLANGSTPTVAAVLSLHRTGSNFLRDVVGLTVSGAVDVFHEHATPPPSVVDANIRPSFDDVFTEPDPTRARQLRRACLRHMMTTAQRRFIFVAERPPHDRLISHFQKRHMAWLQSRYSPERDALDHVDEIQRTFEEWLAAHIEIQRGWYRKHLLRMFGLDVLACQPTTDGLLKGRHAENTLLIVPTARLDSLRNEAASAFGGEAYRLVSSNAVRAQGVTKVNRAFRRQIEFPKALLKALWSIPEVAHLHPRPASLTGPGGLADPAVLA